MFVSTSSGRRLEPEIIEYLGEEAYDYHVAKALITADPLANPDNCTIVVIFGGDFEIASIRYNKDTTWMKITNCQKFDDIVYYKNKIYAVGFMGRLISFDPADTSTIECPAPNFPDRSCSKRYLVESYGELWQVERHYSFDENLNRSTRMFRVYRMDFYQGTWIEIKNLGGAALFVGDSTSLAVLASDFSGCQPNCIYFAHDYVLFHSCKGSNLGMFNVESGSFELHYTIDPTTFFRMVNRPPIWVVPFPKV